MRYEKIFIKDVKKVVGLTGRKNILLEVVGDGCERTDAKLPEYMRRNLREMPNNKGYIFRGIQYYGEKRAERNKPTILFEKNRGVLNIHEITKGEAIKYIKKKTKRSKNKLISSIKRGENPFLKNSYNLLDYIKNK